MPAGIGLEMLYIGRKLQILFTQHQISSQMLHKLTYITNLEFIRDSDSRPLYIFQNASNQSVLNADH